MKEKLPHSTSSLVLGITSIVFCCLPYGLALVLGVFGFIQSKKAIAIHEANPDTYDGIGNAKAGKITAIIGIVLILLLLAIGFYLKSNPELLEQLKTWAEEQQAMQQ